MLCITGQDNIRYFSSVMNYRAEQYTLFFQCYISTGYNNIHYFSNVTYLQVSTMYIIFPMLHSYRVQQCTLFYVTGVYGEVGPWNFSILIDIRGVQELYTVDVIISSS